MAGPKVMSDKNGTALVVGHTVSLNAIILALNQNNVNFDNLQIQLTDGFDPGCKQILNVDPSSVTQTD